MSPSGNTIYLGERESEGKFTMQSAEAGTYSLCFGNRMSTLTPKTVVFSLTVGEVASANVRVCGAKQATKKRGD